MTSPTREKTSDALLLLAFFLSGAAALGYELLWTRLLTLALGSETVGVLATLAGFFGGMALGAAALHRRAETSHNPVRLFVTLELVAAGFAVASPFLLHALSRSLPPLLGPITAGDQGASLVVAVLVATLVLLPGTVCLGATLAALVVARRRALADDADPRGLGRLYAANTAGATAGVLLAVYLVLPALGYALGALVPAALGLAAAALAHHWAAGRDLSPRPAQPVPTDLSQQPAHPVPTDLSQQPAHPVPTDLSQQPAHPVPTDLSPKPSVIDTSRDPDPDLLREPWLLFALTFGSGLAAVGLEVVGVQVLAQNLENTVYTFANILAVFLIGNALGAAIYQRLAARALAGRPAGVTLALLASLAALVVPAALVLHASPDLLAALAPDHSSLARAVAAELAIAALVFLPATLVMGALFAHVTGLLVAAGRGVGRAYALNTLGGALAPFLFGLYAIPRAGYADALYAVLYLYLGLFGLFGYYRRFHPALLVGGALALVALTTAGPRSLALLASEPGWTTLEQHETLHGLVLVSERQEPGTPAVKAPPLRRLQVGKHFKMGGAFSFGEHRMGQLCSMLAAASAPPTTDGAVPKAMFLGIGTGATMGAALRMSPAQADGVELVPELLTVLPRFAAINHDLATRPNTALYAADARRFVVASQTSYDLALADLFHPGQDGAGSLYAEEHFAAVRDHLRPGAVFCQWLPLYQLGPDELRTVVRTYLAVFPEVHAFLGIYNTRTPSLALVGRVPTPDAPALRLRRETLDALAATPGATLDLRDLLASYLADGTALHDWAGEGPRNTDLRPRVLFDAPATAYLDDPELGARNLESLLPLRPPEPTVLLAGAPTRELQAGVRSYTAAADLYLRAELARGAVTELAALPPAAAELLVQAYEADPGFAPARGPLYALAKIPPLAELVLPRMLARTPDEPRVHEAWLRHLQSTGDRARFEAALRDAQTRFPQPTPAQP
ncbi:MAG: hypothetical protein IPO88_21545 [Nannocystis sp.]|uniref:hypothetical protein n=1 Tax=Nannocystis sp. TaxID=1962667 RepID=UPI0024222386|nr:hypothetical protein [Nannocystis sp.]MBK9756039.1 hypothetical protein [Nannocystis sp.]